MSTILRKVCRAPKSIDLLAAAKYMKKKPKLITYMYTVSRKILLRTTLLSVLLKH